MKTFVLAILKEMSGTPAEFQVLPAGKIEVHGDEPAYLDEESAVKIIAAYKSRGNDMVIDYEHQSLADVQSPAAGWIKDLVWKGAEGLWAVVEWTAKAAEYLKNREYRYFSPVMLVGAVDRKVALLVNVALTNNPAMNNLRPIVAKATDFIENQKKEDTMLEKLKKLLGLAADAGEDKVVEGVTLLVNKCTELTGKVTSVIACKEVLDALGAKAEAGKDEIIQIVASLKAPGNAAVALSQQVASLTSKIAAMEQTDLVALALKEGKTSPDELEKWGRDLALKNPESFKQIVLSRPMGSVIPVTEIVVAKEQTVVTDDVQRAVNKQMGIDEETFKKYNK